MRTHYSRDVTAKMKGKKAEVAGWVQTVRQHGSVWFLKIRDREGLIQVTLPKGKVPEKLFTIAKSLTPESVVSAKGTVQVTGNVVEILPSEIEILNKAEVPLPLDISGKIESELDTRLDWRPMDLRNPQNRAIFKIQSKLAQGMKEYLVNENFDEVFTPAVIGAVSEGGADVFKFKYFGIESFLRQDPQLHRELTVLGGFTKIFELGPSWRAELSHTSRHLCEYRGCAIELGFIDNERDTMRVEEDLVISGFKKVKQECKEELELLNCTIEIPKKPFPELNFPKIYDVLKKLGKEIKYGDDYDHESETLLGDYVKKKYKHDFFFVNRFPFKDKPFYVMKFDDEPQWARSVDMIYRGIEQSSGGQREHRYNKIIEQIKEKKMNAQHLKWFTEPFRYGAPPMGGFNLGIERLTKQMLNLPNIREATLFPRDPKRAIP